MHQRHVVLDSSNGRPKTSDDEESHEIRGTSLQPPPKASQPSRVSIRKRRKERSSFWPFLRKRLGKKYAAKADLDLLATSIQILSALIMVACAITLLARALSDEGASEDDASSSRWLRSMFHGGNSGSNHGWNAPKRRHGVGLNAHYPPVPLTPSRFYRIPDAMSHIGDKSDRYALLRKEYDLRENELPEVIPKLEIDPIRTDGNVPVPYDIYNCPDDPPSGYPYAWNLMELLKAWPPDDPTPREQTYQGLCVFDYQKDLEKAFRYRNAELPFIIRNDAQVQRAVKRWNDPRYMQRMLGSVRHRAEYSKSNHFLYWNAPPPSRGKRNHADGNQANKKRFLQNKAPQEWEAPTKMIRMTYEEWLEKANVTDESLLGPEMPHWYFRLIGCGETGPEGQCDNGSSEYLFDELTFFQPKDSLYMVDPGEQKGIHCRFGMKGVIAENHFDGSRNMIAVLGGERRYILSHPDQCPYLALLPKGHPSARHSAVDWSEPDLDAYPEFALAKGNEVVLQAGDVLYLPTNWFHYIISLSLNFQCNTRSGIGQEYMMPIHQCGF